MYRAHIREDGEIETVQEHCLKTAEIAKNILLPIGLSQCGWVAGALHDAGKCKDEFENYLIAATTGGDAVKGGVNHTFAGVRFLLDRWHSEENLGCPEITSEILAFAIGSHHGLFDCIDIKRKSGFYHRRTQEKIGYEEAIRNFLEECVDIKTLDTQFQIAT